MAKHAKKQSFFKSKKNIKYLIIISVFLILVLTSWSWLFLLNPDISKKAEPFISKYFPGLVDRLNSFSQLKNYFDFSLFGLKTARNEELNNQGETTSTSKKEDKNSKNPNTSDTKSAKDDETNQKRPTIQLKIYEGPKFNQQDGTYYFKIRAVVTGDPLPNVQFSRDDSNGALGKYEAQINLKSNEKSYVLTAVASNEHGIAMDSITLTKGGSGNSNPIISEIKLSSDIIYVNKQYEITVMASDPDKDSLTYKWTVSGGTLEADNLQTVKWNTPLQPENYDVKVEVMDSKGAKVAKAISVYVGSQQAPQTTQTTEQQTTQTSSTTTTTTTSSTTAPATTSTIPPTTTQPPTTTINVQKVTGEGGYLEYGGQTYAGGNIYAGDSSTNKPCAGFISFDISSLAGKNIVSAVLTFSSAAVYGNPLEYADAFWINVVSWGNRPIVQNDFTLIGIAVQSFASPSVTCAADKLRTELQKAINEGKSRFQIRVHFSGPYTDNDDSRDGWEYFQNNVNLKVEVQ